MATYRIRYTRTTTYQLCVRAESQDEATEIADRVAFVSDDQPTDADEAAVVDREEWEEETTFDSAEHYAD